MVPVTRLINDTVAGHVAEEVELVIQPEAWLLAARLKVDRATGVISETALNAAHSALSPAAKQHHRVPREGWDEAQSNDRRGVSWRANEDRDLVESFEHGSPLAELSDLHSRSTTAILARLVRFNCLSQDNRGTYYDAGGNVWASR